MAPEIRSTSVVPGAHAEVKWDHAFEPSCARRTSRAEGLAILVMLEVGIDTETAFGAASSRAC